jgi:dihydrofolate reductase
MSEVIAAITTSVDGYVTGPDDRPGQGLGEGGERLHYWVFRGPWSAENPPQGPPTGDEGGWLAEMMAGVGAVIGGRWTYEAADHWGGANPFGMPLFIVTHRTQDEPPDAGFTFVRGVAEAVAAAREAADGKNVYVMGGADIIRQALAAGLVDRFTLIIAPIILGAGKPLFDGSGWSLELEPAGVRQTRYATFVDYRMLGAVEA